VIVPGTDPGVLAFNDLADDVAATHLSGCLHAPGWVAAVLGGRPYPDRASLLATAYRFGVTLSDDDLDSALAAHPRIGDRPNELSRREQSGLDAADAELAAALHAGNLAYEERFGRVFLIRAAGRSGPEMLAALRERLANDDETELRVVRDQLALIAQLRLGTLLDELGA
jgi:2-oxo-4-hydroxy-4-carboxy-5-ureidoimidazoline decarboxylase